MARPPKSIAELKLHGNYREDRHGARADIEEVVSGVPDKPPGLNEHESWMWDLVIEEYGDEGPVRRIDTAALLQACRLWGLLQQSQAEAASDPTDKNLRCAVTSYYAAWDRAAAKLGITPRDRRSVAGSMEKKQKQGVKVRNRA